MDLYESLEKELGYSCWLVNELEVSKPDWLIVDDSDDSTHIRDTMLYPDAKMP
jgi:hypothetical protein